MPTDFITKRPHKKSRGGCLICKTKKIKCDEAHPTCSFCEKKGITCTYNTKATRKSAIPDLISQALVKARSSSSGFTSASDSEFDLAMANIQDFSLPRELFSSSPTLPLPTSSFGILTPLDLKLMHHWTTVTSGNLAVGNQSANTLRIAVPNLAFENGFLMYAVLGIASLQRQQYVTDKVQAQLQTDLYRAKACKLFREALPHIHFGSKQYEAALVMSILVVVLNSKDAPLEDGNLTILQWLIMYRGLSTVMKMASVAGLSSLSVAPIFKRQFHELKAPPVIPTILVKMLQDIDLLDPDFIDLEAYCKALDVLGILYASLQSDGPTPDLFVRIISWPSFITQEFSNCAIQRRPRALVVLAHYLVFVKLVKELWWLDGIADREITAIVTMIGPNWIPYLGVPLRAVAMTDNDEIAKVLLR